MSLTSASQSFLPALQFAMHAACFQTDLPFQDKLVSMRCEEIKILSPIIISKNRMQTVKVHPTQPCSRLFPHVLKAVVEEE